MLFTETNEERESERESERETERDRERQRQRETERQIYAIPKNSRFFLNAGELREIKSF